MDNDQSVESIPSDQSIQSIIQDPIESPKKSFESVIERNKSIIKMFTDGVPANTIAKIHSVSQPQVYNVVRNNPDIITTNREQEKVRRLRRLKLAEMKAPRTLSPRNTHELVELIDAQRRELEPDQTTINIDARSAHNNIDIESINTLSTIIKNMSELSAKLGLAPLAPIEEPKKPYSLIDRAREEKELKRVSVSVDDTKIVDGDTDTDLGGGV